MAPFAFQWHITDACDQRCKHCYIFAENNCKPLESMSFDRMLATLENCEDFCRTFERRPLFYITGGDPILHDDFWRLLERLHAKKYPFTVMGNPFHLDDDVCRRLKALGCRKYQMSLDGLRRTHDFFRKPGSFDATLDKIQIINRAELRSVIMTTVSDLNIDEIPALIDIVAEREVGVFAFARYCPTSDQKSVGITPQRYRQLLVDCDAKFRWHEARGCRTFFNRKDHLWTLLDYECGRFEIPRGAVEGMIYGGCHCGNSHLTILPNGDVLACRRVPNSRVGNVFVDRLADLWINRMEAYREFDKFVKCAGCELKPWCRGCPAVAAASRLLIRGATSALGCAAIQLAKALGATVIGTTHRQNKIRLLEEAGVDEIVLDDGSIRGKVENVTKALELVGPKTLVDTMKVITPSSEAFVCSTGILGGVESLDLNPIGDIPNGVYLTGFYSNYPKQPIIDEMFAFIAEHDLKPKLGRVFDFDELRAALIAQDTPNAVNGKIVVRVQ